MVKIACLGAGSGYVALTPGGLAIMPGPTTSEPPQPQFV